MSKKDLQYKRMVRYFVEATHSIIDSEGIEGVTARKVADIAGFNAATLYNYFDNLNHLIFFASLCHLKDYALALPVYTKGIYHPISLYLKTWECFNDYAFKTPLAYQNIFFGEYNSKYNQSLRLYYEIFPEELPKDGLRFFPMFQQADIHKRDYSLLLEAAKKKILSEKVVSDISITNVLLFGGMLNKYLHTSEALTAEEASRTTTSYQAHTLAGYGVPLEYLESYF